LLSNVLEQTVARVPGASFQIDDPSRQLLPIIVVELISSIEPWVRSPVEPTATMRVGLLELDLINRTARRGDRSFDLQSREFRLLKFMMQRCGRLVRRAKLLEDVWNYKFIPQTNLVDVHLGRLRRKVDASHEKLEPSLKSRNILGATIGFCGSQSQHSSDKLNPKGRERRSARAAHGRRPNLSVPADCDTKHFQGPSLGSSQ